MLVKLRSACVNAPLRLDLERFADANKEDQLRPLETVMEETKRWPEVRKAFQDAFALYRQRDKGCDPVNQGESNQIKPDEACSCHSLPHRGAQLRLDATGQRHKLSQPELNKTSSQAVFYWREARFL
jgi:hypothetical protein